MIAVITCLFAVVVLTTLVIRSAEASFEMPLSGTAATTIVIPPRRCGSTRMMMLAFLPHCGERTSRKRAISSGSISSSSSTTCVHARGQRPRRQKERRTLAQRPNDPLSVERDFLRDDDKDFIIGSDESGTGCLAGPIVTASCCILLDFDGKKSLSSSSVSESSYQPISGVDDGKLLSTTQRQSIYQQIVADSSSCTDIDRPRYVWTIASRTAAEIDAAPSIHQATMDCFQESIQSLADKLEARFTTKPNGSASSAAGDHISSSTRILHDKIYSIVDGDASPKNVSVTSRPWVRADATVYTVALASILARVTRDTLMQQEAAHFYNASNSDNKSSSDDADDDSNENNNVNRNFRADDYYGFYTHGGYPSRQHLEALHHYGPSLLHRKSCKPVQDRLAQ
jgi:ribonuclease HII